MSNVTPELGAGADRLTVKLRVVAPLLPSFPAASLIDKRGNGALTRVIAVAELFAVLKSGVAELTDAVLLIVVSDGPFAVTKRVMSSDEPLAREEKLTVRLLPEPPHTPPPDEVQEINVTVAGRLSVTATFWATATPLFVTTIV